MSNPDKLFIAVRGDLPPGLQMAQAVHAAFQIVQDSPELIRRWTADSNYLVIVQVPNAHELMKLGSAARERDIQVSLVIEPDLADQLTAIAFEPGGAARALCSNLPLALRCPKGCVCEHCDPLAFHYERKVMANG